MSRDVRLLRALASDIPQFRGAMKAHVDDFGQIFSHALMEEFANFVIEALEKSRSAPDAAKEVFEHMNTDTFKKSFPMVFSWVFRLSQFMPDWMYYRLFGAK